MNRGDRVFWFVVVLLGGGLLALLLLPRLVWMSTRQDAIGTFLLALVVAVVGFFLGRWLVPVLFWRIEKRTARRLDRQVHQILRDEHGLDGRGPTPGPDEHRGPIA